MEKKEQPGYRIIQVILMESHFHREVVIDFENLVLDQETNVDSGASEEPSDDNNKFAIRLDVTVRGKVAEAFVFEIATKMLGVFERIGLPEQLPVEVFKKINAPAILYPFTREYIHNVAAKGGVGNILLQPINFTAL